MLEFAKIHMTKKRILTLTIFVTVAILWIFGGYINPILSQLLGLPKPIGSLTVWLHSRSNCYFL